MDRGAWWLQSMGSESNMTERLVLSNLECHVGPVSGLDSCLGTLLWLWHGEGVGRKRAAFTYSGQSSSPF